MKNNSINEKNGHSMSNINELLSKLQLEILNLQGQDEGSKTNLQNNIKNIKNILKIDGFAQNEPKTETKENETLITKKEEELSVLPFSQNLHSKIETRAFISNKASYAASTAKMKLLMPIIIGNRFAKSHLM